MLPLDFSRGYGARVLSSAALITALLLLAWQMRQLALPFQFDYVEGMMLYGVSVASSGQTLYPPLGRLPYLITAYPPLYYYLCAGGNTVFGFSFFFGRLVSLISMVSVALLLGMVVFRRTRSAAAAVLAAAFFYLTLPARNWAILMRVDALEVALALWGFYVALCAPPRPLWRYVAALLFLASFLTKHTMFAAVAAVLLAWWLEGQRREAATLALALVAGAGAIFGLWGWFTGGAFFVYLFGIHPDPVLPSKWFREFFFLARTLPVVLVLAGWFVVDEARRWMSARRAGQAGTPAPRVAIYLLLAFTSSFFGAKLASFWNHYLEFCAVACLAAGCAVQRLRDLRWSGGPAPPGGTGLYGIALALQSVLVLPLMMPWRPGQWYHGAGALVLALGAGWCAYRAYRHQLAALLAAAAVLTFPGVWHWSLAMLSIWPCLLSLAALVLLMERRAELAAAAALAATAAGAAVAPVVIPAAWVLFRGEGAHAGAPRQPNRRYRGLLLVLLALATALLLSPETNLLHSPASLPFQSDLPQWLQQITLLALLALAVGLGSGVPTFLRIYAPAALLLAGLFEDARLWLDAAVALAVLAAGIVRLRSWQPAARVLVPAALLAQLALLSPFELWLAPGYDAAQLRYVYASAAAMPDPIVSENVGLLSAARKPVLLSDPYVARLSPRLFPEEPILEKLRLRQVSLVVLLRDPTLPNFPPGDTDPVWSRRFLETLKRYYRKTEEYDIGREKFYFFTPRGGEL